MEHARSMTNSLASLSDRALALEAALQSPNMPRDTLEEAAAWKELGDCQTQDEKELAGTRALEESVRVYERIREKGGEESTGAGIQGMGEALMVSHRTSRRPSPFILITERFPVFFV